MKGEAASLTDRYGFLIGLPLATSLLAKKKIQYQYSHGIGKDWIMHYSLFGFVGTIMLIRHVHRIGINQILNVMNSKNYRLLVDVYEG